MISFSQHQVEETQSGTVTTTILDETGAAVTLASVTTMTMTSYDSETKQIVGARNGQDVLNTNNCTYHATSGLFTWTVLIADTVLANQTKKHVETHVHRLRVTWSSGAKAKAHAFLFVVTPLTFLP